MRRFILLSIISALFSACSANSSLPDPAIATVARTALFGPSQTPSVTLIPTPRPPHPLTIEYLRHHEYVASEILIEEVLDVGDNYFRYLASYQSEGLKIYALLTIPFGDKPEAGWPVVVFNHGYINPEVYRTTERYIAYVDGFARSGYIVFRPDYRGHGSSRRPCPRRLWQPRLHH